MKVGPSEPPDALHHLTGQTGSARYMAPEVARSRPCARHPPRHSPATCPTPHALGRPKVAPRSPRREYVARCAHKCRDPSPSPSPDPHQTARVRRSTPLRSSYGNSARTTARTRASTTGCGRHAWWRACCGRRSRGDGPHRAMHSAAGMLARDTGEAAQDGLGACAPAGALRKSARPSLAPSRPRRDQHQAV